MIKVEQLDLFDLISERHNKVRRLLEEKWNESSDITISNSEWFILAKISGGTHPTIASLAKEVQISRQATHKFIKKLETKGIVEMFYKHNNRDKFIQLTELGEMCVNKYLLLKKEVEEGISERVGKEQLTQLKNLLKSDWGL
ncbi:MarR family transcriptional regulator [Lysinibacillus yapensis]|uniref:MarR family transcriptional regulator n=1 Tax=Ureibacillus yapensis TaxID=2304605 RepID=A0A396S7M2_9BACL|nr:MarR family winged helix-turn-helix transcriptional regulator [Lysinibacillus yapensis]RHW33446.1 MarR family transcriptional regulator [Lysinibacillus yapensis]